MLTVKSREIMYLCNKPQRFFFLPCLERLNGAEVAGGALRYLAVVELQVVPEGGGQFGGVAELGTLQQFGDAPVEALHHAIGLWAVGRDQTVLGADIAAGPVEGMPSGRFAFALDGETVGELLAIVGQEFLDSKRAGGSQALEESLGTGGPLVGQNLEVDPPAGAVNRHAEVSVIGLVRHLRQFLEVDVEVAWSVVLEGLPGGGLTLPDGDQFGQPRDALALQEPSDRGARRFGVDVGAGDRSEVVERQQQDAAKRHHQRFLRRAEGRLHRVRAVRSVLRVLPSAPFAYRRHAEIQFPRQRLDGFAARANVVPCCRRRRGLLVQSDQHFSFDLMTSGSPSSASWQTR